MKFRTLYVDHVDEKDLEKKGEHELAIRFFSSPG